LESPSGTTYGYHVTVPRFLRRLYPLQTLLGIFLLVTLVVGIDDVTDERQLTLRVGMTLIGVGLTLLGALGWLITSREGRRPG